MDINPFKPGDLTGERLFFIAGPCVIESEDLCLRIAHRLKSIAESLDITIIFKASYDKANRTSASSFRGPGIDEGLRILERVKLATGLPLITDIHSPAEATSVATVVDILQIPAFLCRQTDLLVEAGATGKYVNIKKGQFVAPWDMQFALVKTGPKSLLTERGSSFGYNRLVVDFTGIHIMKSLGAPVIFDATHSVQMPSAGNGVSSGFRQWALPLANAAICQGINGLFFEVHPDPDKALCDGPNSLSIDAFEKNVPFFLSLFHLINQSAGASS